MNCKEFSIDPVIGVNIISAPNGCGKVFFI